MKDSFDGVRQDTVETINNFVKYGLPPGGFVEAVLENNLTEAFGRADMGNRLSLWNICNYVYNEIPSNCHGNPQKVNEWINRGGLEGMRKQEVTNG